MSIKIIFSIWLCIDAAFAFYLAIKYHLENKPKAGFNIVFEILCLASGIWSAGFGFMFVQENASGAYYCRTVAILGTFLFMICAQKILCDISEIDKKAQTVLNSIAYLGVFLYAATIQPGQTTYELTKFGMTYMFTPGLINILYNAYFVIVSMNILILSLFMKQKGQTRRTQIFGRRFLIVEILVITGTVFDVIFPTMGLPALPGSNVTQFWGIIVIWFAIHAINRSEITLTNMSEYIYKCFDKPVAVFDTKKQIRIMNEAAGEFLNCDPHQIVEGNFFASRFFDVGNDVFDFEEKSKVVVAESIPNGIATQMVISKITDKYGDVIGYIVMTNDMTEHNMTIAKLEHERQESDEANISKSLFLANMSHEIRTPMNSIIGFIDLALKEKIDNTSREYFNDIRNSAESLLTIINDVLNISKIEAGKKEIMIEKFRPAEIFDELRVKIEPLAKKKNISFELSVDEDFPDKIEGDREKIKEILFNLLTNSIKFTEVGRVTLTAKTLSLDSKMGKLQYIVSDTGVGIKDEDKCKIFKKFQEIDPEKKRSEEDSSGLGLAICKGYVEQMGGDISFESVYGLGTAFTVTLDHRIVDAKPICLEKPSEEKKSTEPLVEKGEATMPLRFKDVKFLAVDDNKVNLKVIGKTMSQYGIDFDLANSGQEAVDLCKYVSYDLILMDQMMPVMDGVEAMKLIREYGGNYAKGGSCKIVALTANVINGVKEELLEAGFDYYIGKPIDFKLFEETLCDALPEDKYYYGPDGSSNETAVEKTEQTAPEPPKKVFVYTPITDEKNPREIVYEKGLDNFGGDEESYKEILSFVTETGESDLEELMGLFEASNVEEFTIKVHGMKSQCYYVGADKIGDEAKCLEFAGKDNNKKFIEENVIKFTEHYREFIDEAKKYLAQ